MKIIDKVKNLWRRVGNNIYYLLGYVGINTSIPQRPLHIVGVDGATTFPTIGAKDMFIVENNANSNLAFIGGTNSITGLKFYESAGAAESGQVAYNNNGDYMFFNVNGAVERMRIDSAGKLGLGGTPSVLLHIFGTGNNCILRFDSIGNLAGGNLVNLMDVRGNNGSGTNRQWGHISVSASDVTDTSEDSNMNFGTIVAGSESTRMQLGQGLQVGSPTGGDKGAGTINATAVYDDNVLLTDYVFDKYFDGKVKKGDKNIKIHPLNKIGNYLKKHRHLPTMPSRKEWEEKGKLSTGQMISKLWETIEVQQLYINEINDKLNKLNKNI